MIDVTTVTIGTDAEIPIVLLDGTFFPVTGLVGGTKEEPKPLPKLPAGFAIQEDNVNVEFNVPPAKTRRQFEGFINSALIAVSRSIPPTMMLARDSNGHWVSSAKYKKEFLDHPQCLKFGCDPDMNVYTGSENPRPRSDDPYQRTAAAHIHVGWDNPTHEDREALVRALDATIAYRHIGMDDMDRKVLYGKAGTYRPKPYGVEYRVTDNKWLDWAGAIYDQIMEAINLLSRGYLPLSAELQMALVESINSGRRNREVDAALDKAGVFL